MTCPSSVPKAARSLLVERFGSVEAFGVLWYCIVATQLAFKPCDLFGHETAEGHDERLGIPYAMHPGNCSLLFEYAPRFRVFSP